MKKTTLVCGPYDNCDVIVVPYLVEGGPFVSGDYYCGLDPDWYYCNVNTGDENERDY